MSRIHFEETRKEICVAVMGDVEVRDIAALYGVPYNTIYGWIWKYDLFNPKNISDWSEADPLIPDMLNREVANEVNINKGIINKRRKQLGCPTLHRSKKAATELSRSYRATRGEALSEKINRARQELITYWVRSSALRATIAGPVRQPPCLS